MSLRVDLETSASDCENLREDWERLLSERESPTPFETFEWNRANLISFENDRALVLVFRDRISRVIAILPLVQRERRKHLRRGRWIEFAGLPYADYGTCLINAGYELPVARALVDYLRSSDSGWSGLYLDNMRQTDVITRLLPIVASNAGMFATSRPTFNIRRLTRTAFLSNLSTGLQSSKTLATAKRKLSRLGEVNFEVRTGDVDVLKHLASYFEMHIERGMSKGIESPLAAPSQQKFFRNIVATCSPSGLIWLSSLCCNGRPIAYRFSLCYRNSLHLYSTCFAPEFAKYSPSMLLLEFLLGYAFGNGIEVIDFGMGESPQKEKSGATAEQQMSCVEVYHRRGDYIESRLYHVGQRQATKSRALRQTAKMLRNVLPNH